MRTRPKCNSSGLRRTHLRKIFEGERDKRSDADSATPRVNISLKTESGKPSTGVTVRLDQTGVKDKQPAWAEGTSESDGIALDRILPFGHYRIKLETPEGWRASVKDIAVEFEKGMTLNGIKDIAVRLRLQVTRELAHPLTIVGAEKVTWTWIKPVVRELWFHAEDPGNYYGHLARIEQTLGDGDTLGVSFDREKETESNAETSSKPAE